MTMQTQGHRLSLSLTHRRALNSEVERTSGVFTNTDVQESFVSEEDARLSVYSANSCFLFIITAGLTTG